MMVLRLLSGRIIVTGTAEWQIILLQGITQYPGFAGQKLVAQCIEKVARLRSYLDSLGYENMKLEVDGNCSFENIPKMLNAGADIFVAETSSIFDKTLGIKKAMEKLRKLYK